MKLLFESVCDSCPLAKARGGMFPVNPRWHSAKRLKYLFIGEAPGKEEEERGSPFIGPAGRLLSECIKKAGLKEEECQFSNTCWCAPQARHREDH